MRPPRVLLMQDGQPLVGLLAWLFEDSGFEVATVTSPGEAMHRFGGDLPGVVVLNATLTPETGSSLVAEWHALAPLMRVIEIRPRGANTWTGADATFEMPFDADDLLAAARDLQA